MRLLKGSGCSNYKTLKKITLYRPSIPHTRDIYVRGTDATRGVSPRCNTTHSLGIVVGVTQTFIDFEKLTLNLYISFEI